MLYNVQVKHLLMPQRQTLRKLNFNSHAKVTKRLPISGQPSSLDIFRTIIIYKMIRFYLSIYAKRPLVSPFEVDPDSNRVIYSLCSNIVSSRQLPAGYLTLAFDGVYGPIRHERIN